MGGNLKGVNYGDPISLYRGEKVVYLAKRLWPKLSEKLRLEFAIDLFYTLYLPYPLLRPASEVEPERAREYYILRTLIDSEDFHALKIYTIGNTTSATLLSASLIDHIGKELEREGLSEGGEGEEGSEAHGNVARAVRRALKKVMKESSTLRKIERLMSTGLEAGKGSTLDLEESGEDVIKLARNTDLEKLLEILSIMPDINRKIKRRYDPFSRGEFRGYDIGKDLERIVPTELMLPKIYFKIKYLESKLLLYEKVLSRSSGPVYLLTDKSGSMEGEKMLWAKATSIALFMRSRRERRDFYMRFFDGLPHELIKVSRRSKPREVVRFLEYLSKVKGGGGTDITKAIVRACDDIKGGHVGKTSDIIIITDGEDNIADGIIRRKLRLSNARLVAVMILGENRDLRSVSENYLRALRLSKEEIIRVVEA
ncbi:MAG: hypothetical protein DRO10_01225 [Thermoprotei archaeon]|nr:MAG: hypothetical protein DRO10_01225 [Thermoprotei archaeon]